MHYVILNTYSERSYIGQDVQELTEMLAEAGETFQQKEREIGALKDSVAEKVLHTAFNSRSTIFTLGRFETGFTGSWICPFGFQARF